MFNMETNQLVKPRHLMGRERQKEFLSEDCVLETHNSNSLSSQLINIIAFLANVMDGEGDNTSPTTTFKHPRIDEAYLINEGWVTFIEEDDQEVFVDALDDRPTLVSPNSLRAKESKMLSLATDITPLSFSQRTKDPTTIREVCHDLNKAVSAQGMKPSALRKIQQGSLMALNFNLLYMAMNTLSLQVGLWGHAQGGTHVWFENGICGIPTPLRACQCNG